MLGEKCCNPVGNLGGGTNRVLFHLLFCDLECLQVADVAGARDENYDHQYQGEEDPYMKEFL